MKKTITLIIGLVFLTATSSFAGSEVSGKVINKAKVKKSANIAIGKGATANMAAVTMKDSKVSGKVINKAKIKKSANIAIGKNAEASMGSVTME